MRGLRAQLGLGLSHIDSGGIGFCSTQSPGLLHADFVANRYYRRAPGQLGVTELTFSEMFTFARTGTADYVDVNGDTQTAADGVPRIGHHVMESGQLVNAGIRIEPGTPETLSIASSVHNAAGFSPWPNALSIAMDGYMTYQDTTPSTELTWLDWSQDADNNIQVLLIASTGTTGLPRFRQEESGTATIVNGDSNAYAPGSDVPFGIASRHGATFINGAHDGTLQTERTPTALADLSGAAIGLATTGTEINIRRFTVIVGDIGDTQIEAASDRTAGFNFLCPFDPASMAMGDFAQGDFNSNDFNTGG